MVTRKTQIGWMALGGAFCLFAVVLTCKLQGNSAQAQDKSVPPPDPFKDVRVTASEADTGHLELPGKKEETRNKPADLPKISSTSDALPLPPPVTLTAPLAPPKSAEPMKEAVKPDDGTKGIILTGGELPSMPSDAKPKEPSKSPEKPEARSLPGGFDAKPADLSSPAPPPGSGIPGLGGDTATPMTSSPAKPETRGLPGFDPKPTDLPPPAPLGSAIPSFGSDTAKPMTPSPAPMTGNASAPAPAPLPGIGLPGAGPMPAAGATGGALIGGSPLSPPVGTVSAPDKAPVPVPPMPSTMTDVTPVSATTVTPAPAPKALPGEPPLAPPPGPVQTYQVREKGETLRDIARRTLGSSDRWNDIHKLNPSLKAETNLDTGTVVRLPADACIPSEESEAVRPLPGLRPKVTAPKVKVILPLTGTYQANLDDKKTMTLPKAIREQLAGTETLLVSPGPDKCLWLTNQAHLDRLAQRLEQSPAREVDVRVFKRLYFAQTEKRKLTDGRVTIPERLAQFAGLHQEVVLVGIDDHFEVWDAARWREYTQEKSAAARAADPE